MSHVCHDHLSRELEPKAHRSDERHATKVWEMGPVSLVRRGSPAERGSATVVMLAVIASILALTIAGLSLTSAVLASHRARASADLAALAAAGALARDERALTACGRPRRLPRSTTDGCSSALPSGRRRESPSPCRQG
jgi:secretion/DNA translocation related TadE-like protein